MAAKILDGKAIAQRVRDCARDLQALCREADVLVVDAGEARLIGGEWIEEGATVIDVGMNRDDAGKLMSSCQRR